VGMKGSRVQNVVQELQGERVDIVPWSPDPAKYAYNALAPAQVNMVLVDEEARSLLVIVPNDQLSLAIGRQGQNVRLAAKLLGWRIDVKSEQRYANLEDPGYQSLLALPGVEEALADQLLSRGITSTAILADAAIEDLTVLRAIGDEQAVYLIKEARKSLGLDPEAPIEMKRIEPVSVEDDQSEQADQEEHADVAVPAEGEAIKDAPEVSSEDVASEDGVDSGSQE
jgi:transcription termination/antitermination protein NusA